MSVAVMAFESITLQAGQYNFSVKNSTDLNIKIKPLIIKTYCESVKNHSLHDDTPVSPNKNNENILLKADELDLNSGTSAIMQIDLDTTVVTSVQKVNASSTTEQCGAIVELSLNVDKVNQTTQNKKMVFYGLNLDKKEISSDLTTKDTIEIKKYKYSVRKTDYCVLSMSTKKETRMGSFEFKQTLPKEFCE